MVIIMKKILALVLVLMLVTALFVGCGKTQEKVEKKFTVGFSIITLNIPYYAEMQETFIKECNERGWEYVIAEAGMDVEKTLNDCSDMIQQKVDALVIASWYGESLGDTLDQAKAAGIPVYFLNTGGLSDDDPYVGHVIADDIEVGRYEGTWAAQYFIKQGKSDIKMVATTSASTVGRNRVDGFLKGLKDGGVTAEYLQEYIADSRETCMASIEDALTTYSQIDLIYGIGTNNNLGALDAIDAAKRTDPVIVGWDLSTDDKSAIDAKGQFVATLNVSAKFEMSTTMDHVAAYAKGEKVEKLTNYYPDIYTADGFITSKDVFGK